MHQCILPHLPFLEQCSLQYFLMNVFKCIFCMSIFFIKIQEVVATSLFLNAGSWE